MASYIGTPPFTVVTRPSWQDTYVDPGASRRHAWASHGLVDVSGTRVGTASTKGEAGAWASISYLGPREVSGHLLDDCPGLRGLPEVVRGFGKRCRSRRMPCQVAHVVFAHPPRLTSPHPSSSRMICLSIASGSFLQASSKPTALKTVVCRAGRPAVDAFQ